MDPTLYEEINRGLGRPRAATEMKTNLSLDFINYPLKKERADGLFGSCDIELPSPELERFLLQQAYETADGGASGTLSTPTTQILFPKSVTEEQEAYARGFIDALEQLHRSQGAPVGAFSDEGKNAGVSGTSGAITPISMQAHSLQTTSLPSHVPYAAAGPPTGARASHMYSATVHHMAAGHLSASVPFHSSGDLGSAPQSVSFHSESLSTPVNFNTSPAAAAPVEAPQTVPRLGDTPPLSPINMDDQERIKLERKRARNRMAARKCRTRKLEQIATLEMRVNELKSQNAALACSATTLKNEVNRLEQQLHDHLGSGSCFANPVAPGHV